jgi:CspA family cold shock protein
METVLGYNVRTGSQTNNRKPQGPHVRLSEGDASSGEVKFFDSAKGFGFIITDSGKEFFFHITSIQDAREPQSGDKVSFIIGNNKKGLIATEVKFDIMVQ